jgi:hypothetical protein
MPRKAMTCTRTWRDGEDSLRRCEGPMTFCPGSATWTCIWCGRVLTGLYPQR